MKTLPIIQPQHSIDLDIPPSLADIAIVPIDSYGNAGELNSMVLREFGFTERDLPAETRLKHGFSQISGSHGKSILFVVTVSDDSTSSNLRANLYNVLLEFRGWMDGKVVWIPMMGTGSGGLSLQESYIITVRQLNRSQQDLPSNAKFLISIPRTKAGSALLQEIALTEQNLNNDAEKFLSGYGGKMYTVGSIWDKSDQSERFYSSGIWESGHTDGKYIDIIKGINKNDILILKSSYATTNISYLRVKALGLVSERSEDGNWLLVDWRIKGLSLDLPNLGHHRNTISQVSHDEALEIISKLDKDFLKSFSSGRYQINEKETIAGLISDADNGIDHLNIQKDVKAFARVIAAKSFVPPLAIVIFGKWGSGKSFFMRKIKEQIQSLSLRETTYCKGVAHIHFNAWSYMDSNLWASLVSKIFEELNEYISNNSKGAAAQLEIQTELATQLSITKGEIELLNTKKTDLQKEIDDLEAEQKQLKTDIDLKIKSLREKTLWKVLENLDQQFDARNKVAAAFETNPSYKISKDFAKQIIPEKYWNNPDETYKIIKSKYTFLKVFFKKDEVKTNITILALILTLILVAPVLIEILHKKIASTYITIPPVTISILLTVGAVWKRAETVYGRLQPIVASFWSIKEDYQKKTTQELSNFEQEEKILKLEIEKKNNEAKVVEGKIQKVQLNIEDLEYRIKNALATETLYSFIDRRSKSDEYKRHLGIISTIRRDFEILNNLFIDHNNEVGQAENQEKFRKKFKNPLERIVLYIDDLDRCSEDNVVQVLEAVNLIMAYPLFVVVVGVDYRWIRNSLIKKHSLQFTQNPFSIESSDSKNENFEPSKYLEKIFQIPFHLKNADPRDVRNMIRKLARNAIAQPIVETYKNSTLSAEHNTANLENSKIRSGNFSPNNTTKSANYEAQIEDNPEELLFGDDELDLMEGMSDIIGNNPRAIKRFINIYRVVKAHEDFFYEPDVKNTELLTVLFLIAFPVGRFNKLIPAFEDYLLNQKNADSKLYNYVDEGIPSNMITLKDNFRSALNSNPSIRSLSSIPIEVFARHYNFTKRFAFDFT